MSAAAAAAAPGIRTLCILDDTAVAEHAARQAETLGRPDREGVAVLDGYGVTVGVDRGRLVLSDGIGPQRRERRYNKTAELRRVVCANPEGVVSFGALRWCAGSNVAVVVLSADGATLAAGPPGREDARLLRAQALLPGTLAGLAVVRYLIGAKVDGQAALLENRFGEAGSADTLRRLREEVDGAETLEEVRHVEAVCANTYWAAWERCAAARFVSKDRPRVPAAWLRFNGRRSAVNPGSPRSATDPIGAMLNYAYRLAEVEAVLACRRIGLASALGVLHADLAGRESFALDVLEVVRPTVDAHVLGLAAGPLRKRCFLEDSRGVVRLLPPLTHDMTAAMPAYGTALGPVVEHVAGMIAKASPYDPSVPSVLTHAKHRAAARQRVDTQATTEGRAPRGPNPGGIAPRGGRAKPPSATPPLPVTVCAGCGAGLDVPADRITPRRSWCEACLPERRAEAGAQMQAASLAHGASFAAATGERPTHTAEAQAARAAANTRQRTAEEAWAAASTGQDEVGEALARWFLEELRPRLAAQTLPRIARATGASTSAASKWRAGRRRPHQRHWPALAALVGVEYPSEVSC